MVSEPEIKAKRVWLDDLRQPPSDWWVWAKSVPEAIKFLETGDVVEASLDDLHPWSLVAQMSWSGWWLTTSFRAWLQSMPTSHRPAQRCAASSKDAAIEASLVAPGTSSRGTAPACRPRTSSASA